MQRREMADRIYRREVIPAIEELGGEGRLLTLQVNELRKPFEEAALVLRDYLRERNEKTVMERLRQCTDDELLQMGYVSQALGYGNNVRAVDYLAPRGHRVLNMLGARFSDTIIRNLIERFGGLSGILRATKDELFEVDGVGEAMAERLRTGLEMLRNQINMDNRK